MSISELLAAIGARGIQLRRNGDELQIRGDSEALDPEFLSAMREAKPLLLKHVSSQGDEWWSPSFTITPEMLPLVQLKAEDIERLVSNVPGGASNIQDVYPLVPLQEGILFHHLKGDGTDPYVVVSQTAFDSRARLDAYLRAMQAVVNRHDILRTAVMWEGLPEPVQVVWRRAAVPVEEVELDPNAGDAAQQLYARFNPRQYQMDLGQAPLLRIYIAYDPAQQRWLMMHLQHHITMDHATRQMMQDEIDAHLLGQADALPVPLPFRNFVAQARLGVSQQEHENYFRQLLGDLEEPTVPFGLLNVQGDGSGIVEARLQVDAELSRRVRERARKLEVGTASLLHVAWAQVLAMASRSEDVVFGTLLVGRMQGGTGSDRAMGVFINTLPVRLRIGQQESEAVVRSAHLQLAELLWHEHASLALAQSCSAVSPPMPLFSALLNYRHGGIDQRSEQRKRAREGTQVLHIEERTNYPCALNVDDGAGGFWLTAQVQSPIEPMRVCQYMHTALASLADALERTPGSAIGRLTVLPAKERQQLLYEWNATGSEYPRNKCVHELFEEQVAKTPAATAVVFGEEELNYGELNRRANQLAHYLRDLGIKPDARVGICVERSLEMVVGLFAVLKAGAAYVPLDPEYPEGRLQYMLKNSAPVAVLTQGHLWERLRAMSAVSGEEVPLLDLTATNLPWQGQAETNPGQHAVGLTPEHLAYVIYTSGSTGTPKGVMIEHTSIVNRLIWMQNAYGLSEKDAVLQKTPFSFDVSVWEFFWPLLTGARLVMAKPGEHKEPRYLSDAIEQNRITTIHFVPSMLQLFLEHGDAGRCSTLRRIICSGEALSPAAARTCRELLPWAGLHNLYGPTEAAVDVTAWTYPRNEKREITIPIGRPIANTRIYILDAHEVPVPVGVAGELYIGGVQVARGYLNRDDLTAERFLADPFSSDPQARMYKTGDLARFLADGNIEYLGRNDHQVKIRGFRIELGEIEARLVEHPAVHEAVVVAREEVPGDKRLVAYYTSFPVTDPEQEVVGAEQLRRRLSASLPEYMVPAAYVRLESLPLTANGKLDRKALPAPDSDAYSTRAYEPPQGEMETKLVQVWAEVLKVEKIGRHDNFFALGGHSLMAIRVIARVQEGLRVKVGIRDLFAHPVLTDLARALESAGATDLSPIVAVERSARLPLSFAQQRLWFLAQMEGVREAYHILMGLRLKGSLDRGALRKALDRIVARHEALRTTFALVEGEPVQRIMAREKSRFHLVEHDLRERSNAGEELARLAAEEAEGRFDLEAGPLIRGRLIRLGDEEDALLITMHHIVSDGWSMGVFTRELSRLYGAFVRGGADPLPELEIQYADYAVWQRKWTEGEILQQQAAYWKNALAGAPALLELPADHPRPAQQDFAGALAGVALDKQVAAGLKELGRRHGVTLYMSLLAGWAVLLSRLSGQQDVVIGTPTANRRRLEIEGIIGFFVNTLAVRLDLSSSPTLRELLKQVKEQVLAAQQHQDIPFEQIVDLLNPARSLSHSPLFQVMFDWQNNEPARLELEGIEAEPLHAAPHGVARFDMTVSLGERGGSIAGVVEYATSLFDTATIERYFGYFRNLLQATVADDSRKVDGLPMLSQEERQQLLYEWNATEVEYRRDKCVHELFEEQVEKTPEAVAVVFEEEELSYAELNRRANRLAHYLRELGVRADERVAIYADRSPEMIVGMLGVLKAGGAYVPLDPAYPPERLRFMVEDSAPAALLTQSPLEELFAGIDDNLPVLDLTSATPPWQERPESNPAAHAIGLGLQQLAYVIYTSGSTGRPKGVQIEHRGLTNLVLWHNRTYEIGPEDRASHVAGVGFDAAVWECWPYLVAGASLEIAGEEQRLSTEKLQEWLVEKDVTISLLISPVVEVLMRLEQWKPPRLKRILTGADRLHARPPESWNIEVVNHYGPTEGTVLATAGIVEKTGKDWPVIGRPVSNIRVYVLDEQMQPAPIGVAGELYIGGAGLARGYAGNSELTAQSFVPDALSGEAGCRLYRTGDQGRWNKAGELEFVGRKDHQVKLRGFRIELGEIEARLIEHEGIQEAVVLAREDTAGDKRLVAYYTSSPATDAEQEVVGAEQLRQHLSASLPDYMVPAAYVRLESLPLTANKKLDRRALPAPDFDAYSTRAYEPPQGEMETKLAQVWAEVLKVDQIGRHDNFFELGGHSLMAIRVTARVREALKVEVAIRDLFAHPVLTDLARALACAASSELSPIVAVERGTRLPLSFAQQRLWFLAQMEGVSEAYHIPMGLRLKGSLDRGALRKALDRIVARHEALRTTFALVEGEPVQRIMAREESRFHLVEHDLCGRSDAGEELARLGAEEAEGRFDLEAGPLIRGRLIRLGEEEDALLITMHHIVSDGWSMGVFTRELSRLYGAFVRGGADPLPELEIQYADYAVWQRQRLSSEVLQRETGYWRHALAGAAALLELPTDHPRPALQTFTGNAIPVRFDVEFTQALKALARRRGMTPYMVALAAWAAVLSRLSGQEGLVIGSVTANRIRPELESLIGFFVNTQALRVGVTGSLAELLERAKTRILEAQEHQELPFDQVVEILKPPRSLAYTPVFQVMMTWTRNDGGSLDLPRLKVTLAQLVYEASKFDLELGLGEVHGRIEGELRYATALFDPSTIERQAGYLRQALAAMFADESQAVARINLLSDVERRQLLVDWNEIRAASLASNCVHELFEAHATQAPEATAVSYQGTTFTYGELNRRANRLAHYLRSLGVKPDDRVALCTERSLEMVVAIVAVLKAGAGYVPLDPAYPVQRLEYMVEDSAPMVLLAHLSPDMRSALRTVLTSRPIPLVDLQADAGAWLNEPEENLSQANIGLTPQHLAYVIYTSGSTGMPKGVMVEHGNVVRLFSETQNWFHFDHNDVWTLFHSYAFDFSVWEIWGALAYGGKLVVVPQEMTRSPQDFYRLLCEQGVTVLNQTPSAFRQLIAAQADDVEDHRLSHVIFGGEALEVLSLRPWYQRERNQKTRLINMYGITETTVHVTYRPIEKADTASPGPSPIGRPIPDLTMYILDSYLQPVPIGVTGELYVGGRGVVRGYLNRPELSTERFVPDPFSPVAGARIYKTGDLGRFLADGHIEYLGRNDHQVKIRGFRIELGEIEALLAEHPRVEEAVVVAREDQVGDKRLVAYIRLRRSSENVVMAGVAAGGERKEDEGGVDVEGLRAHLSTRLPEYMVPAAYVGVEQFPLTANGKLDLKALPAPDGGAYVKRGYEAPEGEVERRVAGIWAEVLNLERVGRNDNFFELGGHSLLAVTVIARMRAAGLGVSVRELFSAPTLKGLAASVGVETGGVQVPPNRIPMESETIQPEMLPLVKLSQAEIDRIVAGVPGGARNVQDIYPLAPLQQGILFHHLLEKAGDVYLTTTLLAAGSREPLERFAEALQVVIDRHDILRTAVMWEGLPEPVQVVWRKARLRVEEVKLDPAEGDIAGQLRARFDPRRYRMDVRQAPLWRLFVAEDAPNQRWLMLELTHHLVDDNTSIRFLLGEMQAILQGEGASLPQPLPFRNFVAQAQLGVRWEEHEEFFRGMLEEVDEPTVPFGLTDGQGDGSQIVAARRRVEAGLCERLRMQARFLGVSTATMCHLAWGLVLARTSGREDVVFGTVMFGRMQGGEGADRALGIFINTLPLRIRVGEGRSVRGSVRETHETLTQLLRHEHAPLALAQRCSGVRAPAPLFTSLLNYRHVRKEAVSAEKGILAALGMELLAGEERTNYPFSLNLNDPGEGLFLEAQVDRTIDPQRVCAFMHMALESLVEALERSPESAVANLRVLPESEWRQVVQEWNATQTEYPQDKCIHELFEEQVEKTPEAVAVVFEEEELSYGELNRRANRLGRYLRRQGVEAEVLVGICVERSVEMVVGLLGILKAGGAYVPLDGNYPQERLRYMAEDSGVKIVVTGERREQWMEMEGVKLVRVDGEEQRKESGENLEKGEVRGENLAYVIYTSGSTGRPKGVMIQHRSVVNFFHSMDEKIGCGPEDTLLAVTTVAFDISVLELLWTLSRGVHMVLIADQIRGDSVKHNSLQAQAKRSSATMMQCTPSLLRMALEVGGIAEAIGSMRVLMIGGEPLPLALVRDVGKTGVRKAMNMYGPTETTIWSLTHRLGNISDRVPIGKPIANTQVYILDGYQTPVPVGVAGELYIGGAGVARGYLKRPELAAERFLPDPFAKEEGARMYRTGDLVRWLGDGNIEFLGRNDFQVKIRGFRIELGEIEARLREHPSVREAVVVAREDQSGDKRLVAYYTTSLAIDPEQEVVGAEQLRRHLPALLPEHMVPAAYVRMESLPLTPNGKLDRKALPAPEMVSTAAWRAPRTPQEEILCSLFAEVLGLDKVGLDDNFFDLGGHSLMATRLVSRIRTTLGVELAIRMLFESPSVGELASRLRESVEEGRSPLTAAKRPEKLPLSHAQQRLWFIDRLQGASVEYNMLRALRLKGELDVTALERALNVIVERHESLRTRFVEVEAEPFQVIEPDCRIELGLQDLSGEEESARQERVHEELRKEARTPFDLMRGPVLRVKLLRLGSQDHVLLRTMHHIVSDAWSEGVFNHELMVLYEAFGEERENPLPPLRVQYADFALWQRRWLDGGALERGLSYWKEQLAGIPARLELPADRPRPAMQTFAGGACSMTLSAGQVAGVKRLSQDHQSTLYMTLLAVFGMLLSRYSGQDDIVVGSPIANRQEEQLEALIGFFVNSLVMRVPVRGEMSFRELLSQVRQTALAAYEHQDVPFERLVEELSPERSLNTTPLFQVTLALQNAPMGTQQLKQLEVIPVGGGELRARFDVEMYAFEHGGEIALHWLYNRDLFDHWRIEQMVRHYAQMLDAVVRDPGCAAGRVEMLSAVERHQVLYDWNHTGTEFPADKCVHQLFEEQVARTPNAVALVFEGEELSYTQLNARANRLAHYLRKLGVRADERVAICAEPSVEMIVGLLGVLKAGGAYLPLDPAYPVERLRWMIEDSTPLVVVTQRAYRGVVAFYGGVTLEMDALDGVWHSGSEENPERTATPENLAYIIYTSGSAGSPKGVMVEHRELCNHIAWQCATFGLDASDRVLQRTSISFDASVWELWTAFTIGARLVLLSGEARKDPDRIARAIAKNQVTIAQFVPSLLQAVVKGAAQEPGFLCRYIFCGGEPLDSKLVQQARRFTMQGVVNLYGPTEATIDATAWIDTHPVIPERIPIGRPIANTRTYLLDGHGQPVAVGLTGELYIGGAGVARGYLKRPELTAERFLPDPFVKEEGARMYRTGDLGRWLGDGNIEFLGRNDFQVKIRGFRIELGEIEARLSEHEGVQEAVVLAREDTPGDKRLAAYYTSSPGTDPEQEVVGAEELRRHLSASLPEYMVPAAYVRLESLPLTPNGKLDRKALPAPDSDAYSTRAYEPPQGDIETNLAQVWAEVLKLEKIGRHDNFFELGGHSLLTLRVATLLQEKGLIITLADMFTNPTIESLAPKLKTGERSDSADAAIQINGGSAGRPLFFSHCGNGQLLYAFALAPHIDRNTPLYGLPAMPVEQVQPKTIEEMATRMLRMIRSVQPVGPYRVAGWSLGGTIAYEIATQLIAAHEQVEFIAMFDSYCPRFSAAARRARIDFNDSAFLLDLIESDATGEDGRKAALDSMRARLHTMDFADVVQECDRLSLVPDTIRSLTVAETRLKLARAHSLAVAGARYQPHPLHIPVNLFPALDVSGNTSPHRGWNAVVPDDLLRITPAPGSHHSMIRNPNVALLGRSLTQAIRQMAAGAKAAAVEIS